MCFSSTERFTPRLIRIKVVLEILLGRNMLGIRLSSSVMILSLLLLLGCDDQLEGPAKIWLYHDLSDAANVEVFIGGDRLGEIEPLTLSGPFEAPSGTQRLSFYQSGSPILLQSSEVALAKHTQLLILRSVSNKESDQTQGSTENIGAMGGIDTMAGGSTGAVDDLDLEGGADDLGDSDQDLNVDEVILEGEEMEESRESTSGYTLIHIAEPAPTRVASEHAVRFVSVTDLSFEIFLDEDEFPLNDFTVKAGVGISDYYLLSGSMTKRFSLLNADGKGAIDTRPLDGFTAGGASLIFITDQPRRSEASPLPTLVFKHIKLN